MNSSYGPCGRDCPNRSPVCRVDCTEYAAYRHAKLQEYEDKQKRYASAQALQEVGNHGAMKFAKRNNRRHN